MARAVQVGHRLFPFALQQLEQRWGNRDLGATSVDDGDVLVALRQNLVTIVDGLALQSPSV
jgi:hypothetical protein